MVSEFMLQQTQVATVLPYYLRWLERFPTFQALAQASEAEVLALWQGLGYYARARNLHRAAQEVVTRHNGTLPPDPVAIARLPGVGRYTVGAICSFSFDLPVAAVDANIARVLARLINLQEPIDSASGAAKIWETAELLLPPGASGGRDYTSALMELGALVCTPRQPQCLLCPVRSECTAEKPELLPIKKPRRQSVSLLEECTWHYDGSRVLIEKQTGKRWAGLWKLPRLLSVPAEEPIHETQYPFTHHKVTLKIYAAGSNLQEGPEQRWIEVSTLDSVGIAAPHKRAILQLIQDGR
jgi:A/G-specific adenine glycosylase